jgi:hypothetical protein
MYVQSSTLDTPPAPKKGGTAYVFDNRTNESQIQCMSGGKTAKSQHLSRLGAVRKWAPPRVKEIKSVAGGADEMRTHLPYVVFTRTKRVVRFHIALDRYVKHRLHVSVIPSPAWAPTRPFAVVTERPVGRVLRQPVSRKSGEDSSRLSARQCPYTRCVVSPADVPSTADPRRALRRSTTKPPTATDASATVSTMAAIVPPAMPWLAPPLA